MVIKAIGMTMVFLSSCAIGYCMGECYASRERELRNIADALELVQGELSFTMLPLKDIILKITPGVRGVAGSLFEHMSQRIQKGCTAPEAWVDALEVTAPSMSLKKSDALLLSEWSFLMEAYDLEEQQKHLTELKGRIADMAEDASVAVKRNTRLARLLGVYGGALICIIMF